MWHECGRGGFVEGKDHLQDLGVDCRITSKWISNKSAGKAWTGLIWLRI
jgi:hypothetical protein